MDEPAVISPLSQLELEETTQAAPRPIHPLQWRGLRVAFPPSDTTDFVEIPGFHSPESLVFVGLPERCQDDGGTSPPAGSVQEPCAVS